MAVVVAPYRYDGTNEPRAASVPVVKIVPPNQYVLGSGHGQLVKAAPAPDALNTSGGSNGYAI